MPPLSPSFKMRLNKALERKNWGHQQLCDVVSKASNQKLRRQTLEHWLNHSKKCSKKFHFFLPFIADALGTTVDQLLYGHELTVKNNLLEIQRLADLTLKIINADSLPKSLKR
ncbi:MAG: hypothetical protein COA94_03685 [Rickettsiales bacterium]|nr:MAG: hypothetical protein COA94_03685 [Rickettsiales bacterium]